MGDVILYNTRTLAKEKLVPIESGHVGIYSCGPTVYSPQHIGNLRPYLFADLLRRAIEMEGLEVRHVINVTDVGHLVDDADDGEDKMEKAAAETGRRAEDIAAEYTQQWLDDRRSVNVADPDVLCRATEHVDEQIAMLVSLPQRVLWVDVLGIC